MQRGTGDTSAGIGRKCGDLADVSWEDTRMRSLFKRETLLLRPLSSECLMESRKESKSHSPDNTPSENVVSWNDRYVPVQFAWMGHIPGKAVWFCVRAS
jgi:hypothetical protein